MNIKILFEDDYLMVINKPAGVVVNRVETEKGETVEEWVEERKKEEGRRKKGPRALPFTFYLLPSSFVSRSGIVHRLDKETSGCLIIAKTPEAFTELQRQFKAREVKKEYLVLVHGKVEPKEGTIKVPIARSHHDRDKFAVVAGGRISETGYRVINYLVKINQTQFLKSNQQPITNNQQLLSLLCVFPKTGRTHQIRVHFKYFGYPLVSDEKYAGNIALEDRKWCPRIFLHAAKITFNHPITADPVLIEAPLPGDLTAIIKQLTI